MIVLGLLALMAGVVVATVRGVTDRPTRSAPSADKALNKAAEQTDALGHRPSTSLDEARTATEDAAPMIATGVLTRLVSGFGTLDRASPAA